MTASVLQGIAGSLTTASATTKNTAFTAANCTVGSCIEAWVTCSGTTAPANVTDSAGQNYVQKLAITDGSTLTLWLYVLQNNQSATKLSVTATWASGQTNRGVSLNEIGGVACLQAGTGAPVGQEQTTPGTGTNAITTGTLTPTVQPCLISGCCIESGASVVVPTKGTGFTTGITLFSGSAVSGLCENLRLTATTAKAATWTDATDGAANKYYSGVACYTEGTASTVTPTTGSVTYAGIAPTNNLACAPPIGTATLAGIASTLGLGITPTTGAATCSSSPLLMAISKPGSQTITPSTGAVVLTTNAVPQIAAGTLTITGQSPAVITGTVLSSAVGAVTLTGAAPTLTQLAAVIPGTGAITIGLAAPTMALGLAPGAGSVTINGVAIGLVQGSLLGTSAGLIALSGASPALIQGSVVTPPVGAVTLSGVAPTEIRATLLAPSVGALSLSGVGSTLGLGVASGSGALTLTGAAPGIAGILAPSAAALSLSGSAASLGFGLGTSAGALNLASGGPVVGLTLAPTAGAMTFTGVAPVFGAMQITPSAATLSLLGTVPVQSSAQVVNTGALALSADPPRVRLKYAAPPAYLLPAASSIPMPSPGAYYLQPAAAQIPIPSPGAYYLLPAKKAA